MYEQIARNKRRTVFLILGTLIVVGALGYLFGLLLGTGPVGLIIALERASATDSNSSRSWAAYPSTVCTRLGIRSYRRRSWTSIWDQAFSVRTRRRTSRL